MLLATVAIEETVELEEEAGGRVSERAKRRT
jgi:hypothetical protein